MRCVCVSDVLPKCHVRLAAWPALVGVAALLAVACGGSSPVREQSRSSRLQATLDQVRHAQGIPGAAAAVVVPGKGEWAGSSGLADVRTHEPVRPDTMFAAASVTKPFIAALVLTLAQDGVLGLDDHLSRWIPSFPGSRRITLRELLSHTSGQDDYVGEGRFLAAQRRRGVAATWTPQQLLRYVPSPLAPPGARWNYANTNYLLLGLVVERATGSTVARELRRRVLPRATFGRTVFQGEERPRGAVAVGYQHFNGDQQLDATQNNPLVPSTNEATSAWSSGNLLTSAGDLARAGDRLFRGNVLNARSRQEMTHWVKAVFDPPEYGLGLARAKLGGEEVWGHSGDIGGFHSDLWYVPRTGVTVAALINLQAGPEGTDKHRLAEALIADARKLDAPRGK